MIQDARIDKHPVLGDAGEAEEMTIHYNGRPLPARKGDTVAAALLAQGVRVFRHSHKKHQPRGLFCAIGHCTDCAMTVDGVPNTRVCMTLVRQGMQVTEGEGA